MLGMPWREQTRVEGRRTPLAFCSGRQEGGQKGVSHPAGSRCSAWQHMEQGQAEAGARAGGGPQPHLRLRVEHCGVVAAGGLVAVAWAHGEHVGHDAEGGQVLHGLVGGAVLAQADGVVGHHVDHARLAQQGGGGRA